MARIRLRIEPPGAPPFGGEYEGPSVVLGRSTQATVPVADASLSRLHARFFERDGAWYVEDLGSKNATLLNGRVLQGPTPVHSRDSVRMAGTRVEIDPGAGGTGAGVRGASGEGTAAEAADPAELEEEPLTGLFEPVSTILERSESSAPRSLKLLNDVHRALARPITVEGLVELVLDSAFTHLTPEEGALFLRRPNGELYRAKSRQPPGESGEFVYSRRLIREVVEGGKAALVEDISRDERFASSESLISSGVRSLLAAPLLDAEGSLGMIVLHSRAQVRQFREPDLDLLVSLASAAALRLRTILHAEEAAARRLLDKELALAHEIQMGMLPKHFPERPEFEIAAALRPARSVGGDLYDFLLTGDRLWLMVGDVSGKGVAAALVMAMTRTLFHAVVPDRPDLPSVAGRMNQELARDNDRAMFVTAFLGCLDLSTGMLEYANAGHNPPYRVTRAGSLEAVGGARGLPLGVFEDQSYATERLALAGGDGLFACTDGVMEATSPTGEAFGESRLQGELRRLGGGASARRLVEGVLAAVDAFVSGAPPADDVTILTLRWRK